VLLIAVYVRVGGFFFYRGGGERTDGGRLDHVADREPLDCLVLGGASRAVGATNWLHMATALLVTATIAKHQYPLLLPNAGWVAYLDARFLTMMG